jgi:hypothetical protein
MHGQWNIPEVNLNWGGGEGLQHPDNFHTAKTWWLNYANVEPMVRTYTKWKYGPTPIVCCPPDYTRSYLRLADNNTIYLL